MSDYNFNEIYKIHSQNSPFGNHNSDVFGKDDDFWRTHQMMSDYWAAPFIGFLIIVIIMSICSWICRMTKWREDQEYVPRQLYGCGAPDFSDSLRERHPNGFLGSDGIFYVNETTRQQPYTASHGHYLLPSMRQPPPPTPSAPTPTTPPSTSQIAGVHQVLRAPSEDLPPAYDECVVVK